MVLLYTKTSWMLDYFERVTLFKREQGTVDTLSMKAECAKDIYIVDYPFYGTKDICSYSTDEYKLETCDENDFDGVNIYGIMFDRIESIEGLFLCADYNKGSEVGGFEFDAKTSKFNAINNRNLVQTVFAELNGQPCLTNDHDYTMQTRYTSEILKSPSLCQHERNYFSLHPQYNLFQEI